MIVISRSIGESIRLGEHALVRVEQVMGDRVVLAIEAGPKDSVQRGEVLYGFPRLDEEAETMERDSR
ncbi:carbon storage regulator [Aeoliella sp. SH292]|jgi:sRNA-binding carbon storage regulator CsrA|uniref:carbon storage regulator n=1 Tax=Aeoliella sp. SH292 TaxID=3454464 RepID=UPI003F9E8A1B